MLKKILPSVLLILLGLVTANGQWGSAAYKTKYGNIKAVPVPPGTIQLFISKAPPTKSHEYTVLLKSGEIYKGKGKIHLHEDKAYIRFYLGKKMRLFNPEDTKSISTISPLGRKMVGTPYFNDSCWLFKVEEGKINRYSIVPEWRTEYFCAVQKDRSKAPQWINQETVIEMVNDNAAALKQAKKKRLLKAIQIYNKTQ